MAKVTFMFWNLNKRPLLELVNVLAREHRVDVLMLVECDLSVVSLLEALNTDEDNQFTLFPSLSEYVTILGRFPQDSLHLVRDTGRIAVRRLVPPIGVDVLLMVVHLPSKMHQRDPDQTQNCMQIIRFVEEAERKYGHTRTIVCGDFNMDPLRMALWEQWAFMRS